MVFQPMRFLCLSSIIRLTNRRLCCAILLTRVAQSFHFMFAMMRLASLSFSGNNTLPENLLSDLSFLNLSPNASPLFSFFLGFMSLKLIIFTLYEKGFVFRSLVKIFNLND